MKRTIACAAMVFLSACAGHESVRSSYVGTGSMNEDQVTQLLYQQGYTDVTDVHKNGMDWLGSANKDGQVVNFDIDKDGKIHTK